MVLLGIRTERSDKAQGFFKETAKRLNVKNFLRNPFKSAAVSLDENFFVLYLEPEYFKVFVFGPLMMIAALILKGFVFSWWLLPGFLVFSVGIMWTKWPYYLLLIAGLRKVGYTGRVKLVSTNEILRGLMGWGK